MTALQGHRALSGYPKFSKMKNGITPNGASSALGAARLSQILKNENKDNPNAYCKGRIFAIIHLQLSAFTETRKEPKIWVISKNEFSKGQRGDIIVITVTSQHVFTDIITDIIINGRGRHLPEIRNGRI